MKKNVYLVGAGGHCKSCIDVIEAHGGYHIQGLFDATVAEGTTVRGYKVLGSDADIAHYVADGSFFLITVGQIKTPEIRMNISARLVELGAQFATIISPRAYVAKDAILGDGTIVMHDVLVNSAARVGSHCILNTRSLLEHDCLVEDFCHISTGAILNGDVHLGAGSFVGSLSTLQEGAKIPPRSILAAGVFHKRFV